MTCRVYVGNLPLDVREREIDDLFYKYGRIRDIDLKTPARPPAYAFVTFEDPRDAQDAIRARDGYNYDGHRLRVEMSRGGRDTDRTRASGRVGGRRTEYGVIVTGLPRSCSWQDLKDFMRKAGDVVFTDVDGRGEGIVEYSNREDMEEAVRRIDDTEFKNPYDSAYIRVRYARGGGSGGGRDDSRERDRGRANDRRENTRENDRGYSRSRSRDRKRSPSRSVSRGRESGREREPREPSREPVRREEESTRRSSADDEDDQDRAPRGDADDN